MANRIYRELWKNEGEKFTSHADICIERCGEDLDERCVSIRCGSGEADFARFTKEQAKQFLESVQTAIEMLEDYE